MFSIIKKLILLYKNQTVDQIEKIKKKYIDKKYNKVTLLYNFSFILKKYILVDFCYIFG